MRLLIELPRLPPVRFPVETPGRCTEASTLGEHARIRWGKPGDRTRIAPPAFEVSQQFVDGPFDGLEPGAALSLVRVDESRGVSGAMS